MVEGACVVGGMHGREHAWQGGMCGRGGGPAWQERWPLQRAVRILLCRSKIILKNHQTEGENSVHSLSGLSPKLFLKKPSN